jgi:hypothetical protein
MKELKDRKGILYKFFTERNSKYLSKRVTDLILEYRDTRVSEYSKNLEHLFYIVQKGQHQNYEIKNSKIILKDHELVHLTEIGPKEDYPEYFI